jgi:hypothetical protein
MMTGRDLIIYILQNKLEDESVFKDGKFVGFISTAEAAHRFKVGVETVKTWYRLEVLKGIEVGDEIFIAADILSPPVINVDRRE